MTAHPKIDPDTGEMLFFGYMADGYFTPGLSYQVVAPDGTLTRSERFDAPFPSMVHDFIVTSEHVLFPVFPLTGSLERAMQGQPPFAWEPDKGTHVGVMPRDGSVSQIRWFETDPCYVFHPMNAWTEGDRIVAHVMQFEEAPLFPKADGSPADPAKANARLCEWTIDLADNSNGIERRYLDEITGEFPRLDRALCGQRLPAWLLRRLDKRSPRGLVSMRSPTTTSRRVAAIITCCPKGTLRVSRYSCRSPRKPRKATATC